MTQAKVDPRKVDYFYHTNSNILMDRRAPASPIVETSLSMDVLMSLRPRQEGWKMLQGKEVGVVCHRQIITPLPILLIKIVRYICASGRILAIEMKLLTIPLAFEVSEDMVADFGSAKYKLIGGTIMLHIFKRPMASLDLVMLACGD